MSATFSRSAALMRPESPLPRWHSRPSSIWNTRNQRSLGRGVAVLCILSLLAFFMVRNGSSDASASTHRKLGGHLTERSRITAHTSSLIQDNTGLRSQDADVVDNESQHADELNPAPNVESLLQKRVVVNPTTAQQLPPPRGLYALHALDIDGNDISFSEFAGKTLLIVNVASACGYTEQNYKGLQALHEKYGSYGLEIIAFPSNQFGGQEPGTEQHIKNFVTSKYGVTFKLMSKVDVNGPSTHPIFKYLKRHLPVDQGGGGGVAPGNDLVWNFNKFLVDKHGRPSTFYYQNFDGPRLEADIFTYMSAT